MADKTQATQATGQTQSHDGHVRLDRSRTVRADSTVYTMHFAVEPGKGNHGDKTDFRVEPWRLRRGGVATTPDKELVKLPYRWTRGRMIPVLPDHAAKTRAGLLKEIEHWLDTVSRYDTANEFVLSGGKIKDGDGKEIDRPDSALTKKSFRLLQISTGRGANAQAVTITAEQLLVTLLNDAFSLRNQADMQDTLRPTAEQALRNELGLPEPQGKPKAAKAASSVDQADDLAGLEN